MTLEQAVLVGLAAHRIGNMVAREDGPFDVFAELRERVGQTTWVGRGLHCVLCVSFWAALVLVWVWAVAAILIIALAAADVALILHKVLNGD